MDGLTQYVTLEVARDYADYLYTDGTRFDSYGALRDALRDYSYDVLRMPAQAWQSGRSQFIEAALCDVDWNAVADYFGDDLVELPEPEDVLTELLEALSE